MDKNKAANHELAESVALHQAAIQLYMSTLLKGFVLV